MDDFEKELESIQLNTSDLFNRSNIRYLNNLKAAKDSANQRVLNFENDQRNNILDDQNIMLNDLKNVPSTQKTELFDSKLNLEEIEKQTDTQIKYLESMSDRLFTIQSKILQNNSKLFKEQQVQVQNIALKQADHINQMQSMQLQNQVLDVNQFKQMHDARVYIDKINKVEIKPIDFGFKKQDQIKSSSLINFGKENKEPAVGAMFSEPIDQKKSLVDATTQQDAIFAAPSQPEQNFRSSASKTSALNTAERLDIQKVNGEMQKINHNISELIQEIRTKTKTKTETKPLLEQVF